MNHHELDPSAEVVHLRRLLDTQPGCLLRLAADGTVLAANDAALMLLGERSRPEALGRDFALWIPPDQHDRWKAFASGVLQGSASSIECDIAGPSGVRYPTLFHAIPLTDHPDGVASMALSARVVSAQRQLEAAVGELREQLQRRRAELQARDGALEAADAARRTAETECERAKADARQLEIALDEFAKRPHHAAPERGAAEWERLNVELQERTASLKVLEAANASLQAQLQRECADGKDAVAALGQARQALTASQQREHEVCAERDALRRQLEQALASATADRARFASALREHASHLEALARGIPGGEQGA